MLLKKTGFSNASLRRSSCHITNTFLASSILNTSWVRWQVIRPSFSSAIFCKACSTPHTGRIPIQVKPLLANITGVHTNWKQLILPIPHNCYHACNCTDVILPSLPPSSHSALMLTAHISCTHTHTHMYTYTCAYTHAHTHASLSHSSTHQGELIWHFILQYFAWNFN